MEMFLNKKNLNRIFRKQATIIQPQAAQQTPYSTISTFRTIKLNKKLLQDSHFNKPSPIKIENILTFGRHLSSRRKHYSLLSRPKVNFKETKCQRNTAHETFFQTAREKLNQTNHQIEAMNRTISFDLSRRQAKIKELYQQDPIDLQRDEFKRKHESLKKYEESSGSELNKISRNTILSNQLGTLTTTEIVKVKEKRQMQKDFLLGLTKFGQSLSNQAVQSEEMREFFTAVPSVKSIDENQKKKRLDEHMVGLNQGLQKAVMEKYKRLVGKIQESQMKYPTENYEDYDKLLSSKNGGARGKKRRSKIILNCAQEWR